ncbi:hypothetical protein DPMN_088278 [Dreissena polymorpha]|uniref:Uncharacterized protein n=1 Tax=Dreissena polymorpha TaxID=45954 RepID=A0A9D4QWY3_DREPO|nr:hypothetical protein DPMN_088278 [Dreissena polymorpha]
MSQFWTVRCSNGMDAAPASASNRNLEPGTTPVFQNGCEGTVTLHFLVTRFSLYSLF